MDNLFLVRGEHNVSSCHNELQLSVNSFCRPLAYHAILLTSTFFGILI
jgi:hypothetical protein